MVPSILIKELQMDASISKFRYSAKAVLRQTVLLAVLLIYVGLQTSMAFCRAQSWDKREISLSSQAVGCLSKKDSERGHTFNQESDSSMTHCLELLDPSNSLLKKQLFKAFQSDKVATLFSNSVANFLSYSNPSGFLKQLHIHHITNSLFSQKTSLLFYH